MTDSYGRGGVLGAATMLPATSAAGIFLLNHAHTWILVGLFVISSINLIVLVGSISRFLINSRAIASK